jgi:hypothetical protein
MNVKTLVSGVALVIGLMIVTAPSSAKAAEFWCDGGVEFVDEGPIGSGNSSLFFSCWAQGTQQFLSVYTGGAPGSCSAYHRSFETLKLWKATAEAALLGGRVLKVYYESCGGKNHVTTMSLRRQ